MMHAQANVMKADDIAVTFVSSLMGDVYPPVDIEGLFGVKMDNGVGSTMYQLWQGIYKKLREPPST
jgi:hypothetical protein